MNFITKTLPRTSRGMSNNPATPLSSDSDVANSPQTNQHKFFPPPLPDSEHCSHPSCAAEVIIKIWLETLTGESCIGKFRRSDPVWKVKDKICKSEGRGRDSPLWYKRVLLEDQHTLGYHGITSHCTLHHSMFSSCLMTTL